MPLPDLSELSPTQSDSGNASTVNSDEEKELVVDDEHEIDDEGINEEKVEMYCLERYFLKNKHNSKSLINFLIKIRKEDEIVEVDGISRDNWKLLEKVKSVQKNTTKVTAFYLFIFGRTINL
jgi:hypothetical protein